MNGIYVAEFQGNVSRYRFIISGGSAYVITLWSCVLCDLPSLAGLEEIHKEKFADT